MFVAGVSGSVDVGIGNDPFWGSMVELKKYHAWKAKTKMYCKHGHFQNQSPISEMLDWFIMIYLTSLQETPSRPPFKPTKITIFKDHFICRLLGWQVFSPLKTLANEPSEPETTTMRKRHRSCMMHLNKAVRGSTYENTGGQAGRSWYINDIWAIYYKPGWWFQPIWKTLVNMGIFPR